MTTAEWIMLSDRVVAVMFALALVFLLCRVPWARFIAWLSAPSMGSLIFVSAFCIAAQSMLSDESAYKYVPVYVLFVLKFLFGSFGSGFIALKAYRMTPEPPKPESKTP